MEKAIDLLKDEDIKWCELHVDTGDADIGFEWWINIRKVHWDKSNKDSWHCGKETLDIDTLKLINVDDIELDSFGVTDYTNMLDGQHTPVKYAYMYITYEKFKKYKDNPKVACALNEIKDSVCKEYAKYDGEVKMLRSKEHARGRAIRVIASLMSMIPIFWLYMRFMSRFVWVSALDTLMLTMSPLGLLIAFIATFIVSVKIILSGADFDEGAAVYREGKSFKLIKFLREAEIFNLNDQYQKVSKNAGKKLHSSVMEGLFHDDILPTIGLMFSLFNIAWFLGSAWHMVGITPSMLLTDASKNIYVVTDGAEFKLEGQNLGYFSAIEDAEYFIKTNAKEISLSKDKAEDIVNNDSFYIKYNGELIDKAEHRSKSYKFLCDLVIRFLISFGMIIVFLFICKFIDKIN